MIKVRFLVISPTDGEVKGNIMKKIVIAGPPRSGKSCMREGLKQAIRAIEGAPYPYIITACPDGEGSWFQETVNHDHATAAACKAAYKAKFTPEFVQRVADSVRNYSLPLTLVEKVDWHNTAPITW